MLKKCDVWIRHQKPFSTSNRFDSDKSGTKEYKLNSLGFRGEEYNPLAKKRIFVIGDSSTFGVGLNIEETWPYRFKEKYAKKYRYKIESVNIMNFAVGGVSNDFITRTILSQCKRVKPDLLIILFSYVSRTEYVEGKIIEPIYSYAKFEVARDYYIYYTEEIGFINFLKNLLLIQYFCKVHDINYIFCAIEYKRLNHGRIRSNAIIKSLIKLVDKQYFCDFTLGKEDQAVDRWHRGPKSNEIFANKLLKFYAKNFTFDGK
jgi:hypothetical protein